MNANKTLVIIPARGGSKGVPGKNIKSLAGKPLICYSIDVAREIAADKDICVTTDSDEIIKVVSDYGLNVPFKRPEFLATDQSGSYEVLLHAVDHYKSIGENYDSILLLQPTSPFRNKTHVEGAMALFSLEIDMVVSVYKSELNPYYNLFEEENGFLTQSKKSTFAYRQECPDIYAYNGAVYVINIASLLKGPLSSFKKVKKYVMDEISSTDIDTMLDWDWAEFIIEKYNLKTTA
ncbi:MAG: acylneuraminate cytidylyltransferase family protein [Mucilaginibacter sp.]